MNIILSRLKNWGVNTDEAMERFLEDEDLYISCLYNFTADSAFTELLSALNNNDYKAAFDYAHSLKGVSANLVITPLYSKICDIVEALGNNCTAELIKKYEDMMEIKKQFDELL